MIPNCFCNGSPIIFLFFTIWNLCQRHEFQQIEYEQAMCHLGVTLSFSILSWVTSQFETCSRVFKQVSNQTVHPLWIVSPSNASMSCCFRSTQVSITLRGGAIGMLRILMSFRIRRFSALVHARRMVFWKFELGIKLYSYMRICWSMVLWSKSELGRTFEKRLL